eukprot:5046527-Karenia_brevis.AAC.1
MGREVNTHKRLDLFAATPPLESLKAVLSICASKQRSNRPHRIMSIDVSRAYFYAKALRPVFIEIPVEDYEPGDEHRVAELNFSLYGTRDAAQNWSREYTGTLNKLGFIAGKASPCNFCHKSRDMVMTVHGDDFTISAPADDLEWLRRELAKEYSIKSELLGPGKHDKKQIRVLNRVIAWKPWGIEYEADQRHTDIIVKQLGLQKAKAVTSPVMPECVEAVRRREQEEPLNKADSSQYRGLAARLNYLAQDRPDLQYAAKLVAQHMSSLRASDWNLPKRVGR